MVVLWCLAQLVLIAFIPAVIYSFALGLQVVRVGRRRAGDHATTLYFLALNLCEPLVTVVVALARTFLLPRALDDSQPFRTALFTTLPMAILLVPAAGLFFRVPLYRGRSLQILLLGLLRWGTAFGVVYFLNVPAYELGPAVLLVFAALGLLWFSVMWCQHQLRGPLAEGGGSIT